MNPKPPEHADTLQTLTARANHALEQLFPAIETDDVLQDAMRYAVLGGGKRLRPLLTYAAGRAVGDDGPALDAPACAVELIHAYSLVHDDLPAMDDDDLRRGRPTCHVAYGEAMAILAGDALQALAFELLARDRQPTVSDATRVTMLRVLGTACGAQGMAGGQAVDLNATGKRLDVPALERMHALKTGALIRASVRLGALAGGCTDTRTLDALDRYAHAVGLAFQVRDDILDVEADTEALGKTAGKDAAQDKSTFPSLLGMQASRQRLRELTEEAREAVAFLGAPASLLATLARYAAERGN
ncbi:(2E,6E)-farnesyl diphosphate synthase [Oleiagrimonas soli]|uniref:Farnesyl diphosphate synthase n=1 Tax=Oleiagrimonas soli TaxID=1543381 RepID=A0A099CVY1_9GAMM|nr:farnesyl diphosphate synthase [Oleiagrimonas soli]KGI77792.1 geranyl transferase [Oleiagrimonas soli]MBB6183879.1 farnesyl diphosphate synthase [Oleiagrimonas soli]